MTKENWQDFKEQLNEEVLNPVKEKVKANWRNWVRIGWWHIKTVLWVGYFIWLLFTFIVLIFSQFATFSVWYGWDIVLDVGRLLFLIGVDSYLLRRETFAHRFWGRFLVLSLSYFILSFLDINYHLSSIIPVPAFFKSNNSGVPVSLQEWLHNFLLLVPGYYAIFRLGFKKWGDYDFEQIPSWLRMYDWQKDPYWGWIGVKEKKLAERIAKLRIREGNKLVAEFGTP